MLEANRKHTTPDQSPPVRVTKNGLDCMCWTGYMLWVWLCLPTQHFFKSLFGLIESRYYTSKTQKNSLAFSANSFRFVKYSLTVNCKLGNCQLKLRCFAEAVLNLHLPSEGFTEHQGHSAAKAR